MIILFINFDQMSLRVQKICVTGEILAIPSIEHSGLRGEKNLLQHCSESRRLPDTRAEQQRTRVRPPNLGQQREASGERDNQTMCSSTQTCGEHNYDHRQRIHRSTHAG